MEIKRLLESGYIIIPDTNVLLNLYRYSPEFSEFGLQCLQEVIGSIYLPATVRIEFGKHCRAAFSDMEKRINNAGKNTEQQVAAARNKILSSCEPLERLHFPEVNVFRSELESLLNRLAQTANKFFEERRGLELSSHYWGGSDKVAELVKGIESYSHVFPAPSQEDIFTWCEEGQERYKKEIPPGFKDAKNKDGVRKYGDLIIWKELLNFARMQSKDIVFITDDVKADWWESENEQRIFHHKLVAEFEKTGRTIIACESQDFYTAVSDDYGIEKTDAVELALNMTDSDYCDNIKDEVFESISDYLSYNGTDYIDTENAHIGTEGIDEFEVVSWDFISSERIRRDDDTVKYHFKYNVELRGTSYDYWGRDDDTKEVILSYGTNHLFSGSITVEREREANIFIDFEDSNSFDTAKIVAGKLQEISYEENFSDPEFERYGRYGNCPDCGTPLDDDNVGGNGFCINCAPNH